MQFGPEGNETLSPKFMQGMLFNLLIMNSSGSLKIEDARITSYYHLFLEEPDRFLLTCCCSFTFLKILKLDSDFKMRTQMRSLLDCLRLLVGSNGWDYCVVWRLNEQQRVLEGTDCCCAAAAEGNDLDKQDKLLFPLSSGFSCRDAAFHHRRGACCDFLSQLPSSVPLDDSGMYSQVLFSNQPRWFNFFNSPDTKNAPEETIATRVLIPVPGGMVELFVAKQVFEDQQVVDFVISQGSNQLEHQAIHDSIHETCANGYDMEVMLTNDVPDMQGEPSVEHSKDLNDKDFLKPEVGSRRSDSISDCSDQIDDDEDDAGCRKRNGKKPQAKNLEAERRRRKKLNERLYSLRSLVPIISKLDKASILVDAITYLKDLKKQEMELQEELEELSFDEGSENKGTTYTDSDILANFLSYPSEQNGQSNHLFSTLDTMQPTPPLITRNCDTAIENNKVQQMEIQVEVTHIDASKFFIKVFCEHKSGGLVRLLEALGLLGLEVTNVNVTSCRMLVSNVFEVELKKDSEVVAEDLKNSLLELTRIPFGSGWMQDQQLPNKPDNRFDIYHCSHGL